MNRIVVLLFVVLALAACEKKSSPYDTLIPQNEAAWEAEFRPEIKKLGEPDQKLLMEYLARAKKGTIPGQAGIPSGMTIGGAIAEQKKFNDEQSRKAAEAKARKERLEKEWADILRKPGDAIGVKVMSIKVVSDEYYPASKELLCQLAVRNSGKRDVSEVTGRIYFYDKLGREVAQLAFQVDGGIKANSVAKVRWKREFNPYSSEDSALAEWSTSKYKSVFIPEAIVFADGEKLNLME